MSQSGLAQAKSKQSNLTLPLGPDPRADGRSERLVTSTEATILTYLDALYQSKTQYSACAQSWILYARHGLNLPGGSLKDLTRSATRPWLSNLSTSRPAAEHCMSKMAIPLDNPSHSRIAKDTLFPSPLLLHAFDWSANQECQVAHHGQGNI